jgi:hypothetical protein
MRAISKPDEALLFVAAVPGVERLPADAVVATGVGDVAGDLFGGTDHLQTMLRLPVELLLGHAGLPSARGEVAG